MYSKLPRLKERLAKHRSKMAEMEAQALAMEQEIRAAEDEQLGYLARAVANTLSGGMDDVFAILQGLKVNPNNGTAAAEKPKITPPPQNINKDKEGETVDKTTA